MSQPKHARKRRGRVYVWPPEEPFELEVPSSTTIISGGVPKPALKWWAANTVARYAVDHREAWAKLPEDDAYDLIRKAHSRYTRRRGDRGTAVHAAIEEYLGTGRGPTPDQFDDATVELYEAALKFLRDHEPEIAEEHVEATVYNRTHEYAGTADIFARIWGLGGVLDWKTSKRIYEDSVALQLASYAHGEFIGTDDGRELEVPDVEVGVAIRLYHEPTDYDEDGEPVAWRGDYELVPLSVDDDVFETFTAVQRVYEWRKVKADRTRLDIERLASAA